MVAGQRGPFCFPAFDHWPSEVFRFFDADLDRRARCGFVADAVRGSHPTRHFLAFVGCFDEDCGSRRPGDAGAVEEPLIAVGDFFGSCPFAVAACERLPDGRGAFDLRRFTCDQFRGRAFDGHTVAAFPERFAGAVFRGDSAGQRVAFVCWFDFVGRARLSRDFVAFTPPAIGEGRRRTPGPFALRAGQLSAEFPFAGNLRSFDGNGRFRFPSFRPKLDAVGAFRFGFF